MNPQYELVQAAVVNKRISVMIRDETTFQGITGLLYNTVGLTCAWSKPGVAASLIALVAGNLAGAWLSGGFVEVHAVRQPGLYQFDIPNTVLAASPQSTIIFTGGGILDKEVVMDIVDYDPNTIDKTGMSLSSAGILAIWNALLSTMVVSGSAGKALSDNLAATKTAVDAVKVKTDALTLTSGAVNVAAHGLDNVIGYHPAGDA